MVGIKAAALCRLPITDAPWFPNPSINRTLPIPVLQRLQDSQCDMDDLSLPKINSLDLQQADSEAWDAIAAERIRQSRSIELIASENFVSRAVMEAQGSVLTNKYAEGYPGIGAAAVVAPTRIGGAVFAGHSLARGPQHRADEAVCRRS